MVHSANLFEPIKVGAIQLAPGAAAIVAKGDADLAAFGRHFIANRGFSARIAQGLALKPYDRETFHAGVTRGYIDYPFSTKPMGENK
jgi:N-ethylmaleimide reductase